jgi:hypothetical protein
MPRKKKEPKPPSFHKDRQFFISRMLGAGKSPNYKLDMSIAKEIFESFNNDLDFLHKVKPPSWLDPKKGLLYFKSPAGKEYLRKKYQEFKFVIEEKEKPVDLGVKSGEDVLEHKPRTVRQFLNE